MRTSRLSTAGSPLRATMSTSRSPPSASSCSTATCRSWRPERDAAGPRVAELEGVQTTAPTDTDLLIATGERAEIGAAEPRRPRRCAAASCGRSRQAADTGNEGPLWRGADTAAWYAAAVASALWSSARAEYVLRDDASSLVDVLARGLCQSLPIPSAGSRPGSPWIEETSTTRTKPWPRRGCRVPALLQTSSMRWQHSPSRRTHG